MQSREAVNESVMKAASWDAAKRSLVDTGCNIPEDSHFPLFTVRISVRTECDELKYIWAVNDVLHSWT
jgi:hypothetical protein